MAGGGRGGVREGHGAFLDDDQAVVEAVEHARQVAGEAAELLGVTPVSVTRLVGDLKRRGLIREEGLSLSAWDEPGLRALAGEGESARSTVMPQPAVSVARSSVQPFG